MISKDEREELRKLCEDLVLPVSVFLHEVAGGRTSIFRNGSGPFVAESEKSIRTRSDKK